MRHAEEPMIEDQQLRKEARNGKEVPTFQFLLRGIDEIIDHASEIVFDKANMQHLFMLFLYMRIVEIGFSCALLLKNSIISAVPILLRSLVEAFADLRSLDKDPNYADVMVASYVHEWNRFYGEVIEGNNPYLENISAMVNFSQMVEENRKLLEGLKKKGCMPLTQKQRFEKAGMTTEYSSIYNRLCSDSHANIRSLLDRNTHIEGGDFKVMFFKEPEEREVDLYSIDLCDRIVEASLIIHNFFNTQQFRKIEVIRENWENLKGRMLQKEPEMG
jgi:hypothetical protein